MYSSQRALEIVNWNVPVRGAILTKLSSTSLLQGCKRNAEIEGDGAVQTVGRKIDNNLIWTRVNGGPLRTGDS